LIVHQIIKKFFVVLLIKQELSLLSLDNLEV